MATAKKTVAKATESAVPATQHVSRGVSSEISEEDLLLPRIELTQPTSPSVLEEKHKAGIYINSITKDPLPSNTIIPILVTKNYIRWKPRNEGGGIIYRTTNSNDPRVQEDIKWHGQEKPLCTQYINVVCMVVGEEMPIVCSFANTSYQAGRKLLTIVKMTNKDAWLSSYTLKAVRKSNAKGTFYVMDIDRAGASTPEEAAKGAALYAMFSNVKDINMDYAQDAPTQTTTEGLSDEF